ncbi:hypothetical protein [Micromonospora peucetia]|uniref:Uncharacterized protein n=1 Tax=Micromonospora peucetia TaxID=47871 RepID=A0A1C6TUP1_9ACTN|nr:hypothetical protein [Micromonospora peucetia]SCL45504.1 hypothetical protein GA0070608_0003 [Micromonospora peucetia]
MIFFDILVYLAVAKIAVLLLEDAAYAVRGKQSPRRQARARQAAGQKATGDGKSTDGAGGGAGGRSGGAVAAADGYLAGLIEDATERARARRRRAVARKRGAQAVDGVVVDVDDDGRWYADCDLCGWSSRPYRIEANAQGAGREHTRTEHPEQYTGEKEAAQDSDTDSTESAADVDAGEQEPRRPALRVIPGGAQEPATPEAAGQPEQPAQAAQPVPADPAPPMPKPTQEWPQRFHHTKCDRCGKTSVTAEMPHSCPRCGADDSRLRAVPNPPSDGPVYQWVCPRCRARRAGFDSLAAAEAAAAQHTCPPAADTPAPTTPVTQGDQERLRSELYGKCAHREVREGFLDQWCDNPAGGPQGPYCDDHKTTGTDAGDDQHHPTADPAAGSSTTEQLREMTVNLEATGPEEIRAAFTAAAEAAGENAETIGGIAGVLTEAADRYESLEMAASTVAHLRDAAEQVAAAHAALNSAQEELQAALGDFNAKDGQVAEAVADAGGNVASKEVLVG